MRRLIPSILWLSSYRYYLRHPLLLILTLLGLASGVGIVIAIDIATSSAQNQLDKTVASLYGTSTHQIVGGPEGIDQSVFVDLKVKHGIHRATPVISGTVFTQPDDPVSLNVLGVDPFSEASFRSFINASLPDERSLADFFTAPEGVLMSPQTAQLLGIKTGDHFDVFIGDRSASLVLLGLLDADPALNQLLVTDIANAQTLFALNNRITRIDLNVTSADQLALIQRTLPGDLQLIDTQERKLGLQQLTRAFRTNLTAMSLLALLIGAFVVFTTVRFSVFQRMRHFGLYRVMGVTGAELNRLILLEVLLLSLLATVAGVFGGAVLATGLIKLITQTFSDHYFDIEKVSLSISALTLFKAVSLGIIIALITAWFPGRQAAQVKPVTLGERMLLEQTFSRVLKRSVTFGVVSIVIGVVVILNSSSLIAAFAGLFFGVIGYALVVPSLFLRVNHVLAQLHWKRAPVPVLMALRDVTRSISRTGIAVVAMVIALAATIGVALMVGSFRVAVNDWLDQTLRADIYVSLPDRMNNPATSGFTARQLQTITHLPGVRTYSQGRRVTVSSDRGQHELMMVNLPEEGFSGFNILHRIDNDLFQRFNHDDTILISEPFAYHQNLKPGDSLNLLTANGMHRFEVIGVYRDYTTEVGRISMSQNVFEKYWPPAKINTVGLYLEKSADEARVLDALAAEFGTAQNISVRSSQTIRELSLAVFDRTFLITEVLRILILGVAVITVIVALLSWQLEQRRELAIARAIGFLPAQLQTKLGVQSILMGVNAFVFAIPLGLFISAVLVYVINKRAFGWGMELVIEPSQILYAGLSALVAALIAVAYPAYQIKRVLPREAMQEQL